MKKYLLFIVEGKNDRKEIQVILRAGCGQAFFDNYVDKYYIRGSDITTETDSSEKTIVNKLNQIVISWRNGGAEPYQKISPSDVEKIIHVMDTDGAFIPESSVVESDDEYAQYYDDSIKRRNRQEIVGRNRKKAKLVRKLLGINQIDNIPYELLFVSCNMEHLLFDERNLPPKAKAQKALSFASMCKKKEDLQDSIFAEGICASGTLMDSWNMIQEGNNSLARHTNLNLFLEAIRQ